MDFFNTLNSSKEAELAYAKWYSQLPDHRKAKMFSDMFQFGIDTVTYNAKKENPFMTDADALFQYMKLNLKDELEELVFDFMAKKMEQKSEEEWKIRFKRMKEELGWSYRELATFIGGASASSIKASVSRKLPAFAKLSVCVYEQMKKRENI